MLISIIGRKLCEREIVFCSGGFVRGDAAFDTRNPEQIIINENGSNPNVACCEEFYVPMIAEKLVEL